MKHSFNANEESEELLLIAEKAIRDKTEFINRCIQHAGPIVLAAINAERNKEIHAFLKDAPPPGPPGKRKAG